MANSKEQQLARRREYYAKNRARIRAYQREYYLRTRGEALKSQAAYREREGGREANRQYQREWYRRNRRRISAYGMTKRHGMQPEDWSALWEAQEGKCYLCGDKLEPERTHVEHGHSCCAPRTSCPACRRGLACPDCNAAIGYAHDDPDRLRRMADALEVANIAVAERKAVAGEQLIALF